MIFDIDFGEVDDEEFVVGIELGVVVYFWEGIDWDYKYEEVWFYELIDKFFIL